MRRFSMFAVATFALALFGTVAQPATAQASQQADCGSRNFCIYTAANYGGTQYFFNPGPDGHCAMGLSVRSYINPLTYEGYFYEGSNCSGRAQGVLHGTQSPDLGFTAHSFLRSCVSCRTDAD